MQEIIPNLFLGDMVDGRDAPTDIEVLCVMWYVEPCIPARSSQMVTTLYVSVGNTGSGVPPKAMDEAAEWIHNHLRNDTKVLVHCAVGMERSPLTIAWYLNRFCNMSYKEAYELMIEKRPIVEGRTYWLKRELV